MRKAILTLAPLLLGIGASAAAQAPTWQVSEVSGDVRIVDDGRTRAATRGQLLASGSTIATAARARAVLVRGQEYVVVSPSSRLRLPEQPQGQGGIIQMLADWGTALFRIERRATPHFGVQTPYLAAVVKGTVFTVTVGESGASVQVTEGAVEVSTLDGGAAELISPGTLVSVSASDLQQLNIEAETSRSIRSDGTPLPGVVTIPAPQAGTYDGPAAQIIEINAPVTEQNLSLAEATGGLIEGSLGFELVAADVISEGRNLMSGEGGVTPPIRDDAETSPPPAAVDDGNGASPDDGGVSALPADNGTSEPADDDGANAPSPGDDGMSDPPPTSPGGDDGVVPPDDNEAVVPPPSGDDDGTPSDDGDSDGGVDDGNNGHGNDADGDDESNPGNGGDNNGAADGDDGNNGHGNDDDGQDDSNPGNGGPSGNGPPTSPPGRDDDDGIGVCLPGDLLCVGIGGPGGAGNDGEGAVDPPTSPPDDDDGGIGVCLPGDLICIGIGGHGGRDDDGNNGHGNDDDGRDESNPGRGGRGNDD